jgi:signal transduction histidine kinase
VISEAQLALRHPRSVPEYQAGYERVLASARQMSSTLDTLMAAARVELGGRRGTGDAAVAAHAAARGCEALADRLGVAITVVDPELPIRVGVEADVAERVLAPLIENGCRYGASFVRVAVERRDGAVVFLVDDDGPGILAPDREQIFEPGWRGSAAREANADGAGLGLSLARRLARAAGGDVQAESNGAGARFAARLPVG